MGTARTERKRISMKKTVCPHCSASFEGIVCPRCGQPAVVASPAAARQKKRLWVLPVLAAVFAALLALCAQVMQLIALHG